MGLQSLCSVALVGGPQATSHVLLTCTLTSAHGPSIKEQGKGNMPHPEAPPEHTVSCFKRLTKVFEALWQQVPQEDPTAHNVLVLYGKVGRHRSYAVLIALLMWSSHLHEPQFWEAIISPIRNEHLQKDGSCSH